MSSPVVLIGTSGWSYPSGAGTWNGVFYPPRGTPGFRASDELAYYAEHFDTVEVNSTFYRIPEASTTRQWVRRTPPGFEFSVKLYQAFTHAARVGRDAPQTAPPADERLPAPSPVELDAFRAGIEPLASAGRMGMILAQFPPSFHASPATRDYLATLLTAFRDSSVAVELRHRTWSDDRLSTTALLGEFDAAWVQIDEPKFRFSIRQDRAPNADRYYLRLHGRNAANWWKHDSPEDRYNYLYSREELGEFADTVARVSPQVKRLYLYLNNHFSAKAVVNATVLKDQLGQQVRGEYRQEMLDRYPELKDILGAPRGLFGHDGGR